MSQPIELFLSYIQIFVFTLVVLIFGGAAFGSNFSDFIDTVSKALGF